MESDNSYLKKWNTVASTTLYGRAYFLSKNILMIIEFAPVYGISATFSNAAHECNIGTELRANTEPTIIASRSVQFPD